MENQNATSAAEQGSSTENNVSAKIQEAQERAMAQYYKSKTPNLKAQRIYYEELAMIWKARLEELKNRMEFIQLSVQLEKGFEEAKVEKESKEANETN